MRKQNLLMLILLLILPFGLNANNLLKSRQTSVYTYIYKLSDKEAEKIYKNKLPKIDLTFFHSLVDSFPTDDVFTGKLPVGHYMKTYSEKNLQKVSITTIQDFEVFIFNNNTDLCIQIYDLKGNLIKDADVRIRSEKICFDKKTQCYLDKKSNRKGLLKVKYNGFTAYYNLSRQYNNSCIKRGTRQLLYGTPIRYVWIPVNFVLNIPVDGVKSIVKSRPQGTIYFINRFFRNTFYRISNWIDGYDYNYSNYRFRNKHTGYMVFNKPKYLPGDTVKFKTFIITRNGEPLNKEVNVYLEKPGKDIELTKLKPYNKGAYTFEFCLHDSLKLQLDRSYTVSLRLNDEKEYISGTFEYEEYELAKTRLALRVDTKEQYRGKAVKLYARGTDENDLNLLDARLEILLSPKSFNKHLGEYTYIPDTLLYLKKKLNAVDETEIQLSDSLFPKGNFDYTVNVRLLTSDNESITESEKISYYYSSEKIDIALDADSLDFRFLKNGEMQPKNAEIFAKDNFGNKTEVYSGTLPAKIPVNPYYAVYVVQSDSLSEFISIAEKPSLLQCLSERTKDSVRFVVQNPRKLSFLYNIYRTNSQQTAGYSDSLNYAKHTKTGENYYVSLRYLWGGKVKEESYLVPFAERKLNITVFQPKLVYPGQQSRVELLVTDAGGKPVEGVDLTAYSLTRKFNYTAPVLPNPEKLKKSKSIINNFYLKDVKLNESPGLQLDYAAWKILARLDSIEYYRFIYPADSVYRFEYNAPDAITQFAPFVVYKGDIMPIHVIYADSKPIYFSWSTNYQPYSFRIDSGYHHIKIRTATNEFILDSVYFAKGKKLIFSMDLELKNPKIKVSRVDPKLSDYEKRLLYQYIVPYRNNFGDNISYLAQGENIHLLKPQTNYLNRNLAGPFIGNIQFQLVEGFNTNFTHEPFFEYDFQPGLLKMRSFEPNFLPEYLYFQNKQNGLADSVITKAFTQKLWRDYLESKRQKTPRYKYPNQTRVGNGRLQYSFAKTSTSTGNVPLNVLLFRYDNHQFLRVYPGNASFFHDLQKGYYRLIFFYSGAKYHVADSLLVRPDGLNFYELKLPNTLRKDSFSVQVSDLIEKTVFSPNQLQNVDEQELHQIYNMYQQQFQYTGVGDMVEGYVYDVSGEPIIGANVVVKGTTYGTVTNFDGYYALKVPAGNKTLIFSYIGFIPQEKELGYNKTMNVKLHEDEKRLDEVVVVGYGVQKKSSLTGAVATVSKNKLPEGISVVSGNITDALQGKMAGLDISYNDGGAITIRGTSTVQTFEKNPLIIINGNVYTGDLTDLDPASIKNLQIIKDASAMTLYGAGAANGVIIIDTNQGGFKTTSPLSKGAEFDAAFYEAAGQSGSLRDNFSDYAFWKPDLTTDKNGKAGFDVVFPDDVTSWETFYLAMNDKKQTGQTSGLIKSYKPLMAQLAIPSFLVQNDTVLAIGKTLNYAPDSVKVETKFELNNAEIFSKSRICTNSLIDSLQITAVSDTMSLKYSLKTQDGYFDGEKREIPVYPVGIQEAKGSFYVLDKDTTLKLTFDKAFNEVTLYAKADVMDVLQDEISRLISYRYSCNEQLASKLKALLAEKSIFIFKDKKFKRDNEIEKIIRLLDKNRNKNGLWGWWGNSGNSVWISMHVLEALLKAESQGYKNSLNKYQITEMLVADLSRLTDIPDKIRLLKILKMMDGKVNYQSFITDIENSKNFSLNDFLSITELKQQCGIQCKTDTLEKFRKSTLYGNFYYSDNNKDTRLLNNDIQNTLLAYRILRADTINKYKLNKIRNYLFENKQNGYWRNTYQSAQIIETLLPDILNGKKSAEKPSLKFSGDVQKTFDEFPFEMKLKPEQKIEVSKTGDFPVYFTVYQEYRNPTPKAKSNDFEISTTFENCNDGVLKAGQNTKLITKINIKKDAEYVMINIPIPAGCSYADKSNYLRNETHREYFKNETTIFCNFLSKGEYTFEVELIARYSGVYTVNPATVELMYFPVFNANNEVKKVKVK